MPIAPGVAAAISIATTVIGTGISVYGSMQQAKATTAIANENARVQERNAEIAAKSLNARATVQEQTAEANFLFRKQEAMARESNAQSIENRITTQRQIDALNLRKRREEGERVTARSRAVEAASGAVGTTGTSRDVAEKLAMQIQVDLEETKFGSEMASLGLHREAAFERLGGKMALAGASLGRYSALAEAGFDRASATATLLTGQRQAEITRLSGAATASAYKTQAFGDAFKGAGTLFSDVTMFQDMGVWDKKPATTPAYGKS